MPQSTQPRYPSSTNYENNRGVIHGSGNIVNSGEFNINQLNITQVTNAERDDIELDRLLDGYTSKDALHNSFHSPPECYSGTRKTVRKEIGEWIDDSSSAKSPLLWLNGPAGVGKSVIAKTIAEFHDQVVASFFFSTSSDRSAATLFPTLAWQMARRIPETRQHIIASLKNNSSLLTSGIKEQFYHLIVLSLKKCTRTFTSLPVMVIDGIDECTDEDMLSRILQVLVRAGESGDMPLRFIICSRPEPRIRAILKKINDQQETECQSSVRSRVPHSLQRRSFYWRWRPQTWIQSFFPDSRTFYTPIIWGFRNPTLLLQEARKLYRPLQRAADKGGPPPEICKDLLDRISLHPVVSNIQIGFSEECEEDIARYLTDQFNAVGHQLGESDVSHLVGRSCGQFLYASTIVRLLEDSDPKDVLEMVRNSSLPTPNLNKLYKVILKRAKDEIRNRAQEGGPGYEKELGILMDTLAILVVFAENVHFFEVRENFAVIERLIGLDKGRLSKKLFKMDSVLNIVPGKSISVYHRSFLEFLQTQKRSGEYYVAYPKALRRFLLLLNRAGLINFVMDWFGQLSDNDRKISEDVKNMALACRRNYFKRSYSPTTMIVLHELIHYSLPLLLLVPFCRFIRQFKQSFIGAPTSSFAFTLIMEYLLLTFFYLFILSFGSFIVSLTIYTRILNSYVLPLFHPFLHPLFVTIFGILLSSRQPETSTQSEDHMPIGGPEPNQHTVTKSSKTTFYHKYVPLLEQYFECNAYPSGSDKASLAERTGIPQRHIDVWFQNHRSRAKKEGRRLQKPLDGGMSARLATNALNTNNVISHQRVYLPVASYNTTTVNTENRQQLNNYQGTGDPPYLKNYRQLLHSYVGRNRLGELTYEDHDQLSPGGMHIWTSIVQLNGKACGQRQGSTKNNARERAAADALAALQDEALQLVH